MKNFSLFLSVLGTLGVLNLGCDRFIKGNGDAEQKNKPVKIEFSEGACLKNVPQELSQFLNDSGPMTPVAICLQKVLKSFMELTKGENSQHYTAKELQVFFNNYLLKENKISAEFLNDIMKIKVLVAGGKVEIATRDELVQFSQFLMNASPLFDELQGKVRLLTLKEEVAQVDLNRIGETRKVLQEIADFVLTQTKMTSAQYQLNDLNLFLDHLRAFINGQSPELEELFKWMPLINATRELLIGDAARLQTQKDWRETKDWLLNSFITFLKFHYVVSQQTFETPTEKVFLVSFLDEVFAVIEHSPILKEKKIFESGKIDIVLDELVKQGFLKVELGLDLIKESYRKAVVYFITSVASPVDLSSFKGITESDVIAIKAEYNIWKATQNLINRAFLELPQKPTLASFLEFHQKVDNKGFPSVPLNDREEYNRAWSDLYNLLNRKFSVLHDDDKRLIVDVTTTGRELSFRGLSQTNIVRSISRMVLRGYGNREERAIFKRKISEAGFIKLEKDFHLFATKTGLIDPDKTTSGKETFDQGKMLVFSSNGDATISASETTELFATLFSGGKTILEQIYKDLEGSSCLSPDKDVFGKPWVIENCFYSQLRSKLGGYFPNIPGFVTWGKKLSEQKFLEWYQAILKVSQSTRHQKDRLESGEIRTMSAILHFVDEIYKVYDLDQSGLLTEKEVRAAYPRFAEIIKKEADKRGFLASLVPESIFMYLVYNGQIPDGVDIILQWIKSSTGTMGEVDRLKIFKLLGTMKEILDTDTKSEKSTTGVSSNAQSTTDASLASGLQQSAPVGSM